MLPTIQSGGFATVQSPVSSSRADNNEPTKDFDRSDVFSSLVRDSREDSKPDDMVEEKTDKKTDEETADDAGLEGKDTRRQADEDRDVEKPDSKKMALDGTEEKGAEISGSGGPITLTNAEDNTLLPRSRPAVHTNNGAPTFEVVIKSIEAGPDMKPAPHQAGMDLGKEHGHSNLTPGTSAAELETRQKTQVAASVTHTTMQLGLSDARELPSDIGRQELGDLKVQGTSSTSQSILRSTPGADAEFRSAQGVLHDAQSKQKMQAAAALTGAKLSVGEKQDSTLGIERQIVATQNQSTPLATPAPFMAEPRQAPQTVRSNNDSRFRSANDIMDLTAEAETPHVAKKPTVAGLAFAPPKASEIASLSQKVTTTVGNDESLRAGMGISTESLIQSTQAVPRSTHVPANELPRHIARQLAEVSQRMPDRPVELSLNPEELGRVRLSISTHDTGITMSLLAERQETLDLMRRHIDQLTQEFHALGFGDVRFSFSQKDESDNDYPDSMRDGPSADVDKAPAEAPTKLSLSPSAGLDLRL